jgi:ribose 5-phosphate isomerase B
VQNPGRIRDLVRKVVYRTLGQSAGRPQPSPSRALVTELDVKDLPFGGEIQVPSGALVTPLARQTAMDRHITIREGGEASSEALAIKPSSQVSESRIVEVGTHYRPPVRHAGQLLTEWDVKDLPFGSEIHVPPGAMVTPLARQVAMDRHIAITEAEKTSRALAIKPDTRVSESRIVDVGKHFRPPQRARGNMVTELDLREAPFGGVVEIPPGAVVTPLARQVAMERHITLRERVAAPARKQESELRKPPSASLKTVAVGADHGGFAMKQQLAAYLEESGYAVLDCGTDSAESVDYPDYAYAVARLVASGQAWRGIIIDGAGIGSCMAANKVPGVRAAMCYDQATAVNSREHNNANVLTLGAGLLGWPLARQITGTWLGTEFGGGRHARRVEKITDIERRFTKE